MEIYAASAVVSAHTNTHPHITQTTAHFKARRALDSCSWSRSSPISPHSPHLSFVRKSFVSREVSLNSRLLRTRTSASLYANVIETTAYSAIPPVPAADSTFDGSTLSTLLMLAGLVAAANIYTYAPYNRGLIGGTSYAENVVKCYNHSVAVAHFLFEGLQG